MKISSDVRAILAEIRTAQTHESDLSRKLGEIRKTLEQSAQSGGDVLVELRKLDSSFAEIQEAINLVALLRGIDPSNKLHERFHDIREAAEETFTWIYRKPASPSEPASLWENSNSEGSHELPRIGSRTIQILNAPYKLPRIGSRTRAQNLMLSNKHFSVCLLTGSAMVGAFST